MTFNSINQPVAGSSLRAKLGLTQSGLMPLPILYARETPDTCANGWFALARRSYEFATRCGATAGTPEASFLPVTVAVEGGATAYSVLVRRSDDVVVMAEYPEADGAHWLFEVAASSARAACELQHWLAGAV